MRYGQALWQSGAPMVRRGFFRLWLVGSVVWIAIWLWSYPWPLKEAFRCTFKLIDNPFCEFRDPYSNYPIIAFAGPSLILIIWFVANWVIEGFRHPGKLN
jgi:hypothetical protein